MNRTTSSDVTIVWSFSRCSAERDM
jgi:hypothetical protein